MSDTPTKAAFRGVVEYTAWFYSTKDLDFAANRGPMRSRRVFDIWWSVSDFHRGSTQKDDVWAAYEWLYAPMVAQRVLVESEV